MGWRQIQLERGNTYFDLRVTPGQKQTIKVQINNYAKEEQKFFINVNPAKTNGNLIIDYSQKAEKTDTASATIADYVTYPESVSIPAEKAGIVSLELAVPEEAFDGILLGGIQVKKDFGDKKAESGISTEYDYILGLMLSENDQPVTPDLKFVGITPESISNNAGLVVAMESTQPINISKVHMVGNIYKEADQNTAVITREITDGGIAPAGPFSINFFNGEAGSTKPLEAGDYLLKLEFTDENNHQWAFDQRFTISKKEAEQVNTQVFVVKKDNTLLYVIIGILLALLLIALWFIFFYLRRKKKEEEDGKVEAK